MEGKPEKLPFNKKYRPFAETAKKAGIERKERLAIAKNPEVALENTSEHTREWISTDMLESFFDSLNNPTFAAEDDFREIGRYLNTVRPDKEDRQELGEQEKRLINLGCRLIEDAFYSGKLLDLDKESKSSLAFTVNMIAKLREESQSKEWFKGFDTKKIRTFISEVEAYENTTMGFSELNTQIYEKREYLENLVPEESREIFSRFVEKLQHAVTTLQSNSSVDREYVENLKILSTDFSQGAQSLDNVFTTTLAQLTTALESPEKGSVSIPQDFRGPNRSLVGYMLDHVRKSYRKKSATRKKISSAERIVRTHIEVARDNSFGTKLKNLISTTLSNKYRDRAFAEEVVRSFMEDPIDKSFVGDPAAQKDLAILINKRNRLQQSHDSFINSEISVTSRIRSRATVPYFIKDFLIANDKFNASGDVTNELKAMGDQIKMEERIAVRTTVGELPTHSFDINNRRGPAYAALHYDTQKMPFMFWAILYLKSKRVTN